jgi:hypothetical protein
VPDDDRPRLLSRSSVPPYVEHAGRSIFDEPESVGEDELERQTLAIRRAERERRRAQWEPARDRMLDTTRLLLAMDLARTSDVRVIERVVSRLDKRL